MICSTNNAQLTLAHETSPCRSIIDYADVYEQNHPREEIEGIF